jgi:peptidoglycan/LPS O-acetylase OafA/YrhL
MVLGWRYLGPVKTIVLTIFFMHGVSWLWQATVGYSLAASYGVLFALGMLAASLVWSPNYQRYRKLPWNLLVAVATALMVGATFLQTRHASMVPLFLTNYFVGIWALTVLVASSLEENSLIHKCLALKPLVFIGTFSYSLYLIHAPLLQMFWQYVFQPLRSQPLLMLSGLLFVGIPLILMAAYLFFRVCERPFMQGRSKTKLGLWDGKTV